MKPKHWIGVWIGLNILDLGLTILTTEIQELPFVGFELNPLIRQFPYPIGFIIYKVVITVIMIPIMYIISTKYKILPMCINGLFVLLWLGGVVLSAQGI